MKQYLPGSLTATALAITWILLSRITVERFEVDGEMNAVYLSCYWCEPGFHSLGRFVAGFKPSI